jgi:hypothetical protein
LVKVSVGDEVCQVDASETGLGRVGFFRAGDVIEHDSYGEGTVVGERCENVWIRYGVTVRMCRSKGMPSGHRLVSRVGCEIVPKRSVTGQVIYAELRPVHQYEPGCLVETPEFGIGQFEGVAAGKLVVSFVSDCGLARIVPADRSVSIRRSIAPRVERMPFLDGTTREVEIGRAELPIVAQDWILYEGQAAKCVGVLTELNVLAFETEEMIVNDLGVGAFPPDVCERFEFLARVSCPGKVTKVRDGTKIELSVDTDDFTRSQVLPADVLVANGERYTVAGITGNTIYVQAVTGEFVQELPSEFRLLYRRLAVPTRCVTRDDPPTKAFIDVEHLRGSGYLPGDDVRDHRDRLTMMGVVSSDHFLVEIGDEKVVVPARINLLPRHFGTFL